jgi:hypothetical protein
MIWRLSKLLEWLAPIWALKRRRAQRAMAELERPRRKVRRYRRARWRRRFDV